MIKDLPEQARGKSFSSIREVERYLRKQTEAGIAQALDDFEGLSPEQMHRLLNRPADSNPDIIRIATSVPDELALEAPITRDTRWILGYLAEHGAEIKLTSRGNFPRALCRRFLQDGPDRWRPDMSVPIETKIEPLSSAHDFAVAFGYLGQSTSKAWITTDGAEVFASGRWGKAYPEMIRAELDGHEWLNYIDVEIREDDFLILQQSAPLVWRLLHQHPVGTEDELFDRFARAFPPYVQPGRSDRASMNLLRDIFAFLVVGCFCEPFGLITSEYHKPAAGGNGEFRYETTPLFRALVTVPNGT
mgnify:FL=1